MTGIDWTATRRKLEEGRASLAELLEAGGARRDQLLRERAQQLAAPPRASSRSADATPALVVHAGSERFALALSRLAGVVPFASCAPLAGAPGEVIGVVNVRGEIWAAMDLPLLLSPGAAAEKPQGGYLVLLRHGRRRVGLRVEQAEQVRDIVAVRPSEPEPASSVAAGPLIEGVTSDGVIMLDLDALWLHRAIVGENAADMGRN